MGDHEEPESDDRLDHVFEELEAEFDASLRWEAEQEAAAAIRAEAGEIALWEHLTRRVGAQVFVSVGALRLDGVLLASYPDFVAVRTADGRQHMVSLGPAVSLRVAADTRLAPATGSKVARRYSLRLALRELARRREPVLVSLVDQGVATGTIEVVGRDYLELAEHELGDVPRRATVTGHRLVPLAAVAAVSLPPDSPSR
jgi:hypothetical protein